MREKAKNINTLFLKKINMRKHNDTLKIWDIPQYSSPSVFAFIYVQHHKLINCTAHICLSQ